jgi:hypothetical protein
MNAINAPRVERGLVELEGAQSRGVDVSASLAATMFLARTRRKNNRSQTGRSEMRALRERLKALAEERRRFGLSTPLGAAAARGPHSQPQAGLPAIRSDRDEVFPAYKRAVQAGPPGHPVCPGGEKLMDGAS